MNDFRLAILLVCLLGVQEKVNTHRYVRTHMYMRVYARIYVCIYICISIHVSLSHACHQKGQAHWDALGTCISSWLDKAALVMNTCKHHMCWARDSLVMAALSA